MSKAFTKESDGEQDENTYEAPALPSGKKNYITPRGAELLRQEYKQLKYKERPEVTRTVAWAASNGDRSENADYTYGKKRLREIDRRLRFLSKRIDAMEVIDPLTVQSEQVLFGATVTFLQEDGQEKTYSIVGIDETDLTKGYISWISPLASALFKARVGDVVTFRSPRGVQEIEIIEIVYKELA